MNTELAIISLTNQGLKSAIKIKENYENSVIYVPYKLKNQGIKNNVTYYNISFKKQVEKLFKSYKSILFIMATGIVVRTIADLIQDKTKDPAILVADEKLKNIISLLSGHIGGANQLCLSLSEVLNSNPVITTATDVNNVGALDIIAREISAYDNENRNLYKEINYKIASGEKIILVSDINLEENLDLRGFTLIDEKDVEKYKHKDIIHISYREKTSMENLENYHKMVPKIFSLGIGCKKDTEYEIILKAVEEAISKINISIKSISKIASIDLKKEEKGIIELAKKLDIPFETYTKDQIINSKIYSDIKGSSFVEKTVGVKSVSAPCSYLAAKGPLILDKFIYNGVTISISLNSKYKEIKF